MVAEVDPWPWAPRTWVRQTIYTIWAALQKQEESFSALDENMHTDNAQLVKLKSSVAAQQRDIAKLQHDVSRLQGILKSQTGDKNDDKAAWQPGMAAGQPGTTWESAPGTSSESTGWQEGWKDG